jgi:hypothetical protein
MLRPRLRRIGQTLSLVAVATAFTVLPTMTSVAPVPVALASDKDDDHRHNNNSNEEDREDRNLEGQVIELYPDRNPPEMVVAQLGGNVTAQILKTDEIALQGVKVGDYVHLAGEYDKGVFYSDAIDVTERYGASNNDNSDSD